MARWIDRLVQVAAERGAFKDIRYDTTVVIFPKHFRKRCGDIILFPVGSKTVRISIIDLLNRTVARRVLQEYHKREIFSPGSDASSLGKDRGQ